MCGVLAAAHLRCRRGVIAVTALTGRRIAPLRTDHANIRRVMTVDVRAGLGPDRRIVVIGRIGIVQIQCIRDGNVDVRVDMQGPGNVRSGR